MSSKEIIQETLAKQIITCALPPGTILDKNKISEDLGVSITPVREALILLAQQGLVEMVPNKYSRVSLIDIDFLREKAFIRSALECSVAEHLAQRGLSDEEMAKLNAFVDAQEIAVHDEDFEAAHNIDFCFHKFLCELTGFQRLWDTIEQSRMHILRAINCGPLPLVNADKKGAVNEHKLILSALAKGKKSVARNQMAKHIEHLDKHIQRLPPVYLSKSSLQK
ncbi:GntR family transcriptional regulator [Rhodobacteraceae bacterium RKSG542]|uniref:GntR family transcriptional regulator n=1 Tax=Pseudovibrio flavus TaxID=2529854 RepID=UPI0012BD7CE9|nr:GntR family transcriptional regulator [Pseudovibrio flavus]MTI18144.1 GntR family transcriptional regulator [Pseudovibrio flavus]